MRAPCVKVCYFVVGFSVFHNNMQHHILRRYGAHFIFTAKYFAAERWRAPFVRQLLRSLFYLSTRAGVILARSQGDAHGKAGNTTMIMIR